MISSKSPIYTKIYGQRTVGQKLEDDPTDIQTAYKDRQSREPRAEAKRYCSVFAAFVLLRVFARQKDSCSWSRYTAQNYQILAHTYSFFMSAAADIKIQRDKDPEIQDTCLLSHTNDF